MIKQIKHNVFQLCFSQFGSCVYLIILDKIKLIIDTSSKTNETEFLEDLEKLKTKPEQINIVLLTHKHYDHVGNLSLFKNAKIYDFKNIKEIEKEIKGIEVIKTPGHTKDSLCFLYKDILFSGDTLFHNGIGRTDLPESQPEKMQESLEKLRKMRYKILCPGHV